MAQTLKASAYSMGDPGLIPGSGRSLDKEMVTHSRTLVRRIPGTEEPGRLPSMGSHRVGHDWSDFAAAAVQEGVLGYQTPQLPHLQSLLWPLVPMLQPLRILHPCVCVCRWGVQYFFLDKIFFKYRKKYLPYLNEMMKCILAFWN